ncbi:MAG: hypothetical protein IJS10_03785 [Alphaproteobacteria bacterium]|nr:hypothetical protein [Alphaproteobacteria bacterium]
MIRSITGYFVFLIASIFLAEKSSIKLNRNWKPVLFGILLQIAVAFALTHIPACISAIEWVARGVMKLKDATIEGTKFCFGYIGGGDLPFDVKGNSNTFIFAFQVLPTIILVSTLAATLRYLRILPIISNIFGYVFRLVFKVKSYIGMVAVAKIFVGQLDAPLLIKNKLNTLPKSEMFVVLALSFATASAAVMPIYSSVIEHVCPDALKHIIISSVLGVISALIVASIAMPTEDGCASNMSINEKSEHTGFMDAFTKGLTDGFTVWWCVVGSLIGTVALIALINYILDLLPNCAGEPITLQRIFGIFMYPYTWLMGIPSQDITAVSQIIGTRLAVNETIAFFDLAKATISPESVVKTIYAINNFGNFSAIGITVAGLAAMAPGHQHISSIIWKAFVAGFLATGLTATIAGMFF